MSLICPTVMPTTNNPHDYRSAIELVSDLSDRLQIDLMDGEFAPNKNLNPIQLWWPDNTAADIHFMYMRPAEHLATLVSLQPNMIILHQESEGDIMAMLSHIKQLGIKAGLALLQDTAVEDARPEIALADHVLIFAGSLGQAGSANLDMLAKVEAIRTINPDIEIGWDGGASLDNVKQLASGGIDVINAGGAIVDAHDPAKAYQQLAAAIA